MILARHVTRLYRVRSQKRDEPREHETSCTRDRLQDSEEERRASFRLALDTIESYPFTGPPGKLLEIGSSVGLFLEARKSTAEPAS